MVWVRKHGLSYLHLPSSLNFLTPPRGPTKIQAPEAPQVGFVGFHVRSYCLVPWGFSQVGPTKSLLKIGSTTNALNNNLKNATPLVVPKVMLKKGFSPALYVEMLSHVKPLSPPRPNQIAGISRSRIPRVAGSPLAFLQQNNGSGPVFACLIHRNLRMGTYIPPQGSDQLTETENGEPWNLNTFRFGGDYTPRKLII